jgi:hypothetical protein
MELIIVVMVEPLVQDMIPVLHLIMFLLALIVVPLLTHQRNLAVPLLMSTKSAELQLLAVRVRQLLQHQHIHLELQLQLEANSILLSNR